MSVHAHTHTHTHAHTHIHTHRRRAGSEQGMTDKAASQNMRGLRSRVGRGRPGDDNNNHSKTVGHGAATLAPTAARLH